MKTSNDPRHQKRIKEMEELFSFSFGNTDTKDIIAEIIPHIEAIDAKIRTIAPEWPIEKIAKIDLAILRLSMYELLFKKEAPPKVIIDEAIELAKAYGNEGSPKFINGALGALV